MMKLEDAWVIITGAEVGPADANIYWRPHGAGYTWDLGEAGVYHESVAKKRAGQRDHATRLVDLLSEKKPGSAGSLVIDVIERVTAQRNTLIAEIGAVVEAAQGGDGQRLVDAIVRLKTACDANAKDQCGPPIHSTLKSLLTRLADVHPDDLPASLRQLRHDWSRAGHPGLR